MEISVDLHTHSIASPDGSLTLEAYRSMLEDGSLDYIAITDHDRIDTALQFRRELGERIIVGQEVTTPDGEIIGLYLDKLVEPGQTAAKTVEAIKAQGGVVYIPHPFETVRKGLSAQVLQNIGAGIDVIEAWNGRAAFQNKSVQAMAWAEAHDLAMAASSDAHGLRGWGRTYSVLSAPPDRDTLVALLRTAAYKKGTVGVRGLLYPKINRLRKRLSQHA